MPIMVARSPGAALRLFAPVTLRFEMKPVEPVIAAVIAPARTSTRPELDGFANRIVPWLQSRDRAAASNEKIELAPIRARVKSANSSSARDSVPVRTTFASCTTAPVAAGRGAALTLGAIVTTFTFCFTTACERFAAKSADGPSARKSAINCRAVPNFRLPPKENMCAMTPDGFCIVKRKKLRAADRFRS